MKIHTNYILRCIEIAQNGLGTTAPNPAVGAVIVYEGKIIGEGFTSPYGGPHAEVNAIAAVKNKEILSQATLYVTLEPCSHHGKTPPCAHLIVEHKIKEVVVGILDPNPMVAGKGINYLKAAGINVIHGVLEEKCKQHHRRFLMFQENKRPYIILKWAETSDGFIAPKPTKRENTPEPYWITNTYSRQLVHKWRSEEQAILVGTNTVLADNPKLDVRSWTGKNPFRVIIDRKLKITKSHHILDKSIHTLVLTAVENAKEYTEGINYEILDFTKPLAKQIVQVLGEYNFTSVLIEGGAQTLQTFITENYWDEARVFAGVNKFGEGIKAPNLSKGLVITKKIGTDVLKIYKND